MSIYNKIIKILVTAVFVLLFITSIKVVIFAEGNGLNIDDKKLFEETNTYEYIGYDDQKYENRTRKNELRFNLDESINNKVDEGAPLLTILTHGLCGSAADWSNNSDSFIFAYSEDSIITKLARKSDCNFYWIEFSDTHSYKMYDISKEVYDSVKDKINKKYTRSNPVLGITDISKHSIVIFEADDTTTRKNNDDVYTEFNYAISNIVKDIKLLNNNKLPRMNLIGHSRGGITNLQYALDHPKLVASMYSLGTPYLELHLVL